MAIPTRRLEETSATNLDLARSIVASWERGDYGSAAWADAEIEFVFADGPTPGTHKGIAAMAASWREYVASWRDARAEAERYLELDSERVLVLLDFGGAGRTSGVEVSQIRARGANLFHFRDGKVTRLVLYFERSHAFEELGLERDGDRTS